MIIAIDQSNRLIVYIILRFVKYREITALDIDISEQKPYYPYDGALDYVVVFFIVVLVICILACVVKISYKLRKSTNLNGQKFKSLNSIITN